MANILGRAIMGGVAGGAKQYNTIIDEQKKMKHDEARWKAETERQENLVRLTGEESRKTDAAKAGLSKGKKMGSMDEWMKIAADQVELMDPVEVKKLYADAVTGGYRGTQSEFKIKYTSQLANKLYSEALAKSPYSSNKVTTAVPNYQQGVDMVIADVKAGKKSLRQARADAELIRDPEVKADVLAQIENIPTDPSGRIIGEEGPITPTIPPRATKQERRGLLKRITKPSVPAYKQEQEDFIVSP